MREPHCKGAFGEEQREEGEGEGKGGTARGEMEVDRESRNL